MEKMIEQLDKYGVNLDSQSVLEFPPKSLPWCDDLYDTCVELAITPFKKGIEVAAYFVPHAEGIVRRTLHLIVTISDDIPQCIASEALVLALGEEAAFDSARFDRDTEAYDISFAAALRLLDSVLRVS